MHAQAQLVLDLAKTGVDVLTVDADAFLLRDPFPYIRNLPTADVLTSSDHLTSTKGYEDAGLEDESGFHSAFNIGYIYIKAAAEEFVQAWVNECNNRPNDWDQVLFATVLRLGAGGGRMSADRLKPLFKLKDGRHLNAGVLPVSLFASGHTFFVSRMAHLMHTQPYMVRAAPPDQGHPLGPCPRPRPRPRPCPAPLPSVSLLLTPPSPSPSPSSPSPSLLALTPTSALTSQPRPRPD